MTRFPTKEIDAMISYARLNHHSFRGEEARTHTQVIDLLERARDTAERDLDPSELLLEANQLLEKLDKPD